MALRGTVVYKGPASGSYSRKVAGKIRYGAYPKGAYVAPEVSGTQYGQMPTSLGQALVGYEPELEESPAARLVGESIGRMLPSSESMRRGIERTLYSELMKMYEHPEEYLQDIGERRWNWERAALGGEFANLREQRGAELTQAGITGGKAQQELTGLTEEQMNRLTDIAETIAIWNQETEQAIKRESMAGLMGLREGYWRDVSGGLGVASSEQAYQQMLLNKYSTDLQAALGLQQLAAQERWNQRQQNQSSLGNVFKAIATVASFIPGPHQPFAWATNAVGNLGSQEYTLSPGSSIYGEQAIGYPSGYYGG